MKKYLLILLTLLLFFQCTSENESSDIFILKKYKASRTSWMIYSSHSDGSNSEERIYSKDLPEYAGNIRFTIYKNGTYLIDFGWDIEISQILLSGYTGWAVTRVMDNAVFVGTDLDLYQEADIVYEKKHEKFSVELILRSYIYQSNNNDGTIIASGAHNKEGDAYYQVDDWLRDKIRRSDTLHIDVPSYLERPWSKDYLMVEKHIFIEPEDEKLKLREHTIYENKTQEFFVENIDGQGNYVIAEEHSYPSSLDLREKPLHESMPFTSYRPELEGVSKLMNEIRENTRNYINGLTNDPNPTTISDFPGNRIQSVKELTHRNVKAAIYGCYSGGEIGMIMSAASVNLAEKEAFSQPSYTTNTCQNPMNFMDHTGETAVTLLDLGLQDLNGIRIENWNSVFATDTFNYEQFYKNGEAWCRANHILSENQIANYSFEILRNDIRKALNNMEISLVGVSFSFLDLGMITEHENEIFNSYFYAFESAHDSKSFNAYSRIAERIVQNSPLLETSKDFVTSIMAITRHSFCYWDQVFKRSA